MKYLVKYIAENENAGLVSTIEQNPVEIEDGEEFFVVEDIVYPKNENIPFMEIRLMIDLESKELYYNYIAKENYEAKVGLLQQENSALNRNISLVQKALDDVILGGTL